MALKRFVFGYRGRWGAEQADVEASSLDRAEPVARKWCETKGFRFLWVRDPVVCREEVAAVASGFQKAS